MKKIYTPILIVTAVFMVLHGLDVWSTALANANGGIETNPLMVDFIQRPIWQQLIVKLGVPLAGGLMLNSGWDYYTRRVGREPSLLMLLPLGIMVTVYTAVVLGNLAVADVL